MLTKEKRKDVRRITPTGTVFFSNGEIIHNLLDHADEMDAALAAMTRERDEARAAFTTHQTEPDLTDPDGWVRRSALNHWHARAAVAEAVAEAEALRADREKARADRLREAATTSWALLDRMAKGEPYAVGNVSATAAQLDAALSRAPLSDLGPIRATKPKVTKSEKDVHCRETPPWPKPKGHRNDGRF